MKSLLIRACFVFLAAGSMIVLPACNKTDSDAGMADSTLVDSSLTAPVDTTMMDTTGADTAAADTSL